MMQLPPGPESLVGAAMAELTSSEFVQGLRIGLLAAVLMGVLVGVWRSNVRLRSVNGVLLACGGVLALVGVKPIPAQGLLALALLGIAPWIAPGAQSLFVRFVMAIPGAWLMSSLQNSGPEWIEWLLFGSMAIGAPLVTQSDHDLSEVIYIPSLLLVSMIGIYLVVPDTEAIRVLIGVAFPLVIIAWVLGLSRIGSTGSYVTVGIMVWAAALGGQGRPSSIIGAVACLGLLLLSRVLINHRQQMTRTRDWPVLVAVHVGIVVLCSRVAGFRANSLEAAVVAVAVLAIGALIVSLYFSRLPFRPGEKSLRSS
jgi:hypothetical protein